MNGLRHLGKNLDGRVTDGAFLFKEVKATLS